MLHFGTVDIRTDIFVLILFFAIILLQLLICFKVKSKILCLLPVIIFACASVILAVASLFFDTWDTVGFLFLAICSALLLIACGIGWWIWKMICKKRK